MLTECLEVFSHQLDEETDALILNSYIPADGTYIIVNHDGEIEYTMEMKMDKKTRQYDKSHPHFSEMCQYDYCSQLISMNKPMDAKKVIHSNSYLSFFVKKESIAAGKLTEEIIDSYFDTLLNPAERKYKKSKEATRIYQRFAEQYGQVNPKEVESKREWIKKNIFSFSDIDMTKKDYLKIFFEEDAEVYEREGQRYFLPNIYNSNEYNIEIEGNACGLPDNNLGMNAKKPFLSIKTRKYPAPYLLNSEDVLLQKKLFDYLMNLVSKGKYNIYVDTSEQKIIGCKNDEAPEKIETGYYLRLKKGKTEAEIHAQDNISGYMQRLNPPFYFENILGVNHKYQSAYLKSYNISYDSRLKVGDLINEVIFSKWLKSNYGLDVGDINISDGILKQNIVLSRDIVFDWVYKGRNHGFHNVMNHVALSMARHSVVNGYVERASWQLNLLYSLKKYFSGEGEEDMAEISSNLKASIESRVLGECKDPLENDSQYYYAVGQLAAFLISLNKSKEKKQSLINPFLNATSNQNIRLRIMQIFKKYNYAIQENSKRVKRMLELVEGYEPNGAVDQEKILLGYVCENVIYYTKEEK